LEKIDFVQSPERQLSADIDNSFQVMKYENNTPNNRRGEKWGILPPKVERAANDQFKYQN